MRKSTVLALLACVNLALLAGIVLRSTALPSAFGQVPGLSDNFLVVSGEVRSGFDAVYLIDARPNIRVFHAMYFDKINKQLQYADSRSLERDFRHNKD